MTSIVIQGKLYSETLNSAENYASIGFIDEIIISCWESDQKIYPKNSKIKVLYNKNITNSGISSMNYQLESSLNGINYTYANPLDLCMKTRSDQHITRNSMLKIFDFYNKHMYDDMLDIQNSNIFVIGINKNYPFHPQDHLFLGLKTELIKLFNIPKFPHRESNDFNKLVREPIWIGSHYYANYNSEIYNFINNQTIYLTDNAPLRHEAMKVYDTMRDKVFKVLPRIDMYWEKYGCGYMYNGYSEQGEYYAD